MFALAFVSNESVCVGCDGGAVCLRWCWQPWRDVGRCVLALALMELGGAHVGAMELGGVVIGDGGLELSLRWRLCWCDAVMDVRGIVVGVDGNRVVCVS